MKTVQRYLRDVISIVVLYVLFGAGVGLSGGLVTAVRNGYVAQGMTEIFFCTLAGSVNHHLKIFLSVAVAAVLLYLVLRLVRVSAGGAVSFGLIPLTTFGILFFYGLPFWPILKIEPGRLIGKVEVLVLLVALAVIVIFTILWFFGLRRYLQAYWKDGIEGILTHPITLLVIVSLPVAVNVLDGRDWSHTPRGARNLILISIDTLRADHLGCYGYPKDISPNIDAFAADGIRFTRAISQSSWTLPAHASLFTGFYPSVHGAYNKRRSIPPALMMLTEIVRNAGYATAAYTGGGFLNPIYGFRQGFDAYGHYSALDSDDVWRYIDDRKEPFFLFLHTYVVHNYYVPEELRDQVNDGFAERFQDLESIMRFVDRYRLEDLDADSRKALTHLQKRYDLAILYIDRQFGALLRGLEERGLLEKTLIVFLSDHGEEFGEHGRTYHGGTLYNEQVHVPLLMRVPGWVGGDHVVTTVVELMDLFPTILEILGLPVPEGIDGQSLIPLIEGRGDAPDGFAFSEISSHVTEKYAVCDSSSKLIYSPKTEYLPLPGDGNLEAFEITWGPQWRENPLPVAENPLAEPFQKWYARMSRLRKADISEDEVVIDPALKEELKALGYIR